LKLPSTGKKIIYRSFLVKEQKILMMALESKDEKHILRAVKQIINNCLVDSIDIDLLPSFDLEYIFLNLRGKSIGEKIVSTFRCEQTFEENPCHNAIEVEVDLDKVTVDGASDGAKKIELGNGIGIVMRYPTLTMMEDKKKTDTPVNLAFDFILDCIDYIYDEDNVYNKSDTSPKELSDFLESLPKEAFDKIQAFFESMPSIKYQTSVKCSKCGFVHDIRLEGLQSFFD
jgi:hypothetical protein